jgi:hypothetical protein
MNQAMDKKFADMILKAMEYREASYDKTAADAETEKVEATGLAGFGIIDYSEFYGLSLEQAAEKAAVEANEPRMAPILNYLLHYAWNDVQVWIKDNNLA